MVVRHPEMGQLATSRDLKGERRRWFADPGPKHSVFYDIKPLLACEAALEWDREIAVRDRFIIALAIHHLARAIDCSSMVAIHGIHPVAHGVSTRWKRGKQTAFTELLLQYQDNAEWSAAELYTRYVSMTAAKRARIGTEQLFLCATRPEKVLTTDRIRAVRKDFLRRHGVDVTVYQGHSLRGATASSLWDCGIDPAIVRVMGEWKKEQSFNEFYLRVQANKNVSSCLVPRARRVSPPPQVQTGYQLSCSASTAAPSEGDWGREGLVLMGGDVVADTEDREPEAPGPELGAAVDAEQDK